jgi:jumonji domain-containing protein 2
LDIDYDHDDVEGHRILRLKPTVEQWDDFPGVLAFARSLGAEGDGCFKVIIPDELQDVLPEKPAQSLPANAYKVKLIRRTAFWQVSTTPSEGVFASSPPDSTDLSYSVDAALKNLKHLFRKNQNKRLRNIRYRVDVPAWTKTQRRLAGVAERSPIYPLKGDKLDKTKAIIPGIHTPYVYESASPFGATFQIHAEDFRLASLNHLYKGRKIWIVVPATDVDVAEKALGRGSGCSQFMRHRAEFFFPDKLDKLGIPYRLVDQRPGETIVILPDAYHEGFSCGYTIAEAKNYADPTWTTDSYQPCEASCRLATAIPAAFMRPLEDGEQRLDLCAAYGEGPYVPVAASMKRGYEEVDGGGHIPDETGGQKRERIDVYE